MYARKASLCLKPDSIGQFILKMESEVLPLFRKQRGFLDQLLISETGNEIYFFSFWETGEDAEHYDRVTLPALNHLLAGVIDGSLHVHNFAGSGGRLSGDSAGRTSRVAIPARSKDAIL
jgi:hypothetical protein